MEDHDDDGWLVGLLVAGLLATLLHTWVSSRRAGGQGEPGGQTGRLVGCLVVMVVKRLAFQLFVLEQPSQNTEPSHVQHPWALMASLFGNPAKHSFHFGQVVVTTVFFLDHFPFRP